MEGERITGAARFGKWMGRRWRGILLFEKNSLLWLQRVGVPINVAKIYGWILKAVVLSVLLYLAFWIALIALAIVFVVRAAFNCDFRSDYEESDWRDGLSGFGLYDRTGVRIDPHDPDEMP
ncbi:hypothetical protein ABH912_000499 [Pseudomonas sp. BT76 TE3572]|uniref:DUF3742 family protein n=1 Tax=Pseudomonas sp. BT76 TE3572 TaxID=3349325 RepID=UPI003D1E99C7